MRACDSRCIEMSKNHPLSFMLVALEFTCGSEEGSLLVCTCLQSQWMV
jgi:hypothetical protein